MRVPSDGDSAVPSCYEDPTQINCIDFEMPSQNATDSVHNLCGAMDWMPGMVLVPCMLYDYKSISLISTDAGCTIQRLCEADNGRLAPEPFCHPVSVLSSICQRDMPRMRGCSTYNAICASPSTAVAQCRDRAPVPLLPTTREALDLVHSICSDMDHAGCDKCDSSVPGRKPCDSLTIYSDLCTTMPNMHQCRRHAALCVATPDFPLCYNSAVHRSPPAMKMFFHTGYADYMLLEGLVPQGPVSYAVACVAIFALAVAYEAFLWLQRRVELQWRVGVAGLAAGAAGQRLRGARRRAGSAGESTPLLREAAAAGAAAAGGPWKVGVWFGGDGDGERMKVEWTPARVRVARCAFRLVGVTSAYALMLLVMNFNVGVFVAVVVGLATGNFMFSEDPGFLVVGGRGAGEEGGITEAVVEGGEDTF
ncbi:hypothetical protein HK101_005975, partial [Irineochytrium annulatum]